MKKVVLILLATILYSSCDQDRCDEGYKPHTTNGQEICIPEFLNGKDHDFKLGNVYYHDKFGVVTLKDGIWRDESNKILIVE